MTRRKRRKQRRGQIEGVGACAGEIGFWRLRRVSGRFIRRTLAPSASMLATLVAQRARTLLDTDWFGGQSAARNEGGDHGQRSGTNGKYRIGAAGSRLTRIVAPSQNRTSTTDQTSGDCAGERNQNRGCRRGDTACWRHFLTRWWGVWCLTWRLIEVSTGARPGIGLGVSLGADRGLACRRRSKRSVCTSLLAVGRISMAAESCVRPS